MADVNSERGNPTASYFRRKQVRKWMVSSDTVGMNRRPNKNGMVLRQANGAASLLTVSSSVHGALTEKDSFHVLFEGFVRLDDFGSLRMFVTRSGTDRLSQCARAGDKLTARFDYERFEFCRFDEERSILDISHADEELTRAIDD